MTKRNAIITGGARGIGAATARALAADGHRVFINFVNSIQAATDLAKEIKSRAFKVTGPSLAGRASGRPRHEAAGGRGPV